MAKYLTVKPEKKVVTIDKNVKKTADDEMLLEMYIKAGYTIRFKSEKRAAAARERAKKNDFGKKKKTEDKE